MTDRDPFRELGKIERVSVGKEDHGIETCWVYLSFTGSGQGFGGLRLDGAGLTDSYVGDLCRVFGVRAADELVGKSCYALRCFDQNNASIEGVQAVDTGRIFSIYQWRCKHFGDTKNPLEEKREFLESTMRWALRRYEETVRDLAKLDGEYRPIAGGGR